MKEIKYPYFLSVEEVAPYHLNTLNIGSVFASAPCHFNVFISPLALHVILLYMIVLANSIGLFGYLKSFSMSQVSVE
jgi:hypothetical protein